MSLRRSTNNIFGINHLSKHVEFERYFREACLNVYL